MPCLAGHPVLCEIETVSQRSYNEDPEELWLGGIEYRPER